MILDVFQKGLILGSERLPFDPSKRYAYAEHPKEGWRVYLRSCVFLHPPNGKQFLVVKRRGARKSSAAWDLPKGQMEGKDLHRAPVLQLLKQNAIRETEEEAHVTDIKNMKHTGLVFQSQEADYPSNHFFQYHIFTGLITPEQIEQSFGTFEWIKEHPKSFARWTRDRKEKDAAAWFNPKETRLIPRWAPDLVALYLRHF
jgi:8-oxo-dGTP pyrophosphatase MutT (NUDIX family)